MSDSSDLPFALTRGVVLAVATWLVLGAWTASFLLGRDPLETVPRGVRVPADRLPVREAVGGFSDFLAGVLAFDVGHSLSWAPGRPALGRVGTHLGGLLAVAVAGVLVAAVVAAPLIWVARRGWRPRLVRAAGSLGAVPAAGWLGVWLVVAAGTPLPLVPKGPLGVVVAGLAVGLPLAAAAVRTAARGGFGGAVVDAWLWGSWLVGAAVTMDAAVGDVTVGYLLGVGLTNADLPLVAAAALVLSLPLVVASPLREVAWEYTGRSSDGADVRRQGTDSAATDGGAVAGLPAVLREDRVVRGGLAAFGVLLVGGVAGTLALSPPSGVATSSAAVVPATLLARLGAVTLVAGVATVVGAGVGVPLGVVGPGGGTGVGLPFRCGAASGRTDARTRASLVRVVDVTTNLPLVVLAVLTLGPGFPGRGVLDADLLVGVVCGLAVASLVLRTTERAVTRTGDWRAAAVPAVGVAATGGVVVALLVAQLSLLVLPLAPVDLAAISSSPARFAVETLVPVALPALALLVVGERLRSVDVVE